MDSLVYITLKQSKIISVYNKVLVHESGFRNLTLKSIINYVMNLFVPILRLSNGIKSLTKPYLNVVSSSAHLAIISNLNTARIFEEKTVIKSQIPL